MYTVYIEGYFRGIKFSQIVQTKSVRALIADCGAEKMAAIISFTTTIIARYV